MKLVGNFEHEFQINFHYLEWEAGTISHLPVSFPQALLLSLNSKDSREGSAVAGGLPSAGPRPVLTLVLCPDLSAATGSVVEASGRVPTQPTQLRLNVPTQPANARPARHTLRSQLISPRQVCRSPFSANMHLSPALPRPSLSLFFHSQIISPSILELFLGQCAMDFLNQS